MAEPGNGEFTDAELEDLFSSFGDVGASDALKASTLEFIAAAAPAAAAAAVGQEAAHAAGQGASGATGSGAAGASGSASASTPKFTAKAGAKRLRSKMRAIRAAAVAACMTLALVGGVAYATPTSIVTLTQGEASIELGVNFFGMSVSAASETETGQQIVNSTNLVHVPYETALSRAVDALDAAAAGQPLELVVESADEGQRNRLESSSQAFLANRSEFQLAQPDSESPSGSNDGMTAFDDESGKSRPASNQLSDEQSDESQSEAAWVEVVTDSDSGAQPGAAGRAGGESKSSGSKSSGGGSHRGNTDDSGTKPDNNGADNNGGTDSDNSDKNGQLGDDDKKDDNDSSAPTQPVVNDSEPDLEWIIEPEPEPDEDISADDAESGDEGGEPASDSGSGSGSGSSSSSRSSSSLQDDEATLPEQNPRSILELDE